MRTCEIVQLRASVSVQCSAASTEKQPELAEVAPKESPGDWGRLEAPVAHGKPARCGSVSSTAGHRVSYRADHTRRRGRAERVAPTSTSGILINLSSLIKCSIYAK